MPRLAVPTDNTKYINCAAYKDTRTGVATQGSDPKTCSKYVAAVVYHVQQVPTRNLHLVPYPPLRSFPTILYAIERQNAVFNL